MQNVLPVITPPICPSNKDSSTKNDAVSEVLEQFERNKIIGKYSVSTLIWRLKKCLEENHPVTCGSIFCHRCSWRKKFVEARELKEKLDTFLNFIELFNKKNPQERIGFKFKELTLFGNNCSVTDLKTTKKKLQKALNEFLKHPIVRSASTRNFKLEEIYLGFLAKFQVARSNEYDECFPHFHVLIPIRSSVTNGKKNCFSFKKDETDLLWKECLQKQKFKIDEIDGNGNIRFQSYVREKKKVELESRINYFSKPDFRGQYKSVNQFQNIVLENIHFLEIYGDEMFRTHRKKVGGLFQKNPGGQFKDFWDLGKTQAQMEACTNLSDVDENKLDALLSIHNQIETKLAA